MMLLELILLVLDVGPVMCCTLINAPPDCCNGPQSSSTVPNRGTMEGDDAGEVAGKMGEADGIDAGEASDEALEVVFDGEEEAESTGTVGGDSAITGCRCNE